MNFQMYFSHQKQKKYDNIYYENIKLHSQLLELQKENTYLLKYKEIYNKIGKNKIKSILEIKSVNNNQNGKYIIAKTQNKVDLNDAVVDENVVFIGRIIEIKDDIVKIQLITDINSNIPVSINKNHGIAFGTHVDKCAIEIQILDNDTLPMQDDIVVTHGIDNLIISGVIVGKVELIDNKICINNRNIKYINSTNKLVVIH